MFLDTRRVPRREHAEQVLHRRIHLVDEAAPVALGRLLDEITRGNGDLVRCRRNGCLEVDPIGVSPETYAPRRLVVEIGQASYGLETFTPARVPIRQDRVVIEAHVGRESEAVDEGPVAEYAAARQQVGYHVAVLETRRRPRGREAHPAPLTGFQRRLEDELVDVEFLVELDQRRPLDLEFIDLRLEAEAHRDRADRCLGLVLEHVHATDDERPVSGIQVNLDLEVCEARNRLPFQVDVLPLIVGCKRAVVVTGRVLVDDVGVVEDPGEQRDERHGGTREYPRCGAGHVGADVANTDSQGFQRPAVCAPAAFRADHAEHDSEGRPVQRIPAGVLQESVVAVHVRVRRAARCPVEVQRVLEARV